MCSKSNTSIQTISISSSAPSSVSSPSSSSSSSPPRKMNRAVSFSSYNRTVYFEKETALPSTSSSSWRTRRDGSVVCGTTSPRSTLIVWMVAALCCCIIAYTFFATAMEDRLMVQQEHNVIIPNPELHRKRVGVVEAKRVKEGEEEMRDFVEEIDIDLLVGDEDMAEEEEEGSVSESYEVKEMKVLEESSTDEAASDNLKLNKRKGLTGLVNPLSPEHKENVTTTFSSMPSLISSPPPSLSSKRSVELIGLGKNGKDGVLVPSVIPRPDDGSAVFLEALANSNEGESGINLPKALKDFLRGGGGGRRADESSSKNKRSSGLDVERESVGISDEPFTATTTTTIAEEEMEKGSVVEVLSGGRIGRLRGTRRNVSSSGGSSSSESTAVVGGTKSRRRLRGSITSARHERRTTEDNTTEREEKAKDFAEDLPMTTSAGGSGDISIISVKEEAISAQEVSPEKEEEDATVVVTSFVSTDGTRKHLRKAAKEESSFVKYLEKESIESSSLASDRVVEEEVDREENTSSGGEIFAAAAAASKKEVIPRQRGDEDDVVEPMETFAATAAVNSSLLRVGRGSSTTDDVVRTSTSSWTNAMEDIVDAIPAVIEIAGGGGRGGEGGVANNMGEVVGELQDIAAGVLSAASTTNSGGAGGIRLRGGGVVPEDLAREAVVEEMAALVSRAVEDVTAAVRSGGGGGGNLAEKVVAELEVANTGMPNHLRGGATKAIEVGVESMKKMLEAVPGVDTSMLVEALEEVEEMMVEGSGLNVGVIEEVIKEVTPILLGEGASGGRGEVEGKEEKEGQSALSGLEEGPGRAGGLRRSGRKQSVEVEREEKIQADESEEILESVPTTILGKLRRRGVAKEEEVEEAPQKQLEGLGNGRRERRSNRLRIETERR